MSGDESLGDGHTHWYSPEDSLTSNGMNFRKSHMINHNNFNYHTTQYGIDKHENTRMQKAPWCTNKDR